MYQFAIPCKNSFACFAYACINCKFNYAPTTVTPFALASTPTMAPTSVIPVLYHSTKAVIFASTSEPEGPSKPLLAPTKAEPEYRPVSTFLE